MHKGPSSTLRLVLNAGVLQAGAHRQPPGGSGEISKWTEKPRRRCTVPPPLLDRNRGLWWRSGVGCLPWGFSPAALRPHQSPLLKGEQGGRSGRREQRTGKETSLTYYSFFWRTKQNLASDGPGRKRARCTMVFFYVRNKIWFFYLPRFSNHHVLKPYY
jgi:hypothetical protein